MSKAKKIIEAYNTRKFKAVTKADMFELIEMEHSETLSELRKWVDSPNQPGLKLFKSDIRIKLNDLEKWKNYKLEPVTTIYAGLSMTD